MRKENPQSSDEGRLTEDLPCVPVPRNQDDNLVLAPLTSVLVRGKGKCVGLPLGTKCGNQARLRDKQMWAPLLLQVLKDKSDEISFGLVDE